MSDIWTIDPGDVCRLQENDREMVRFVTALLEGQCLQARLPAHLLRSTLRTTVPDGGVDAALDGSIPPPLDATGLLDVPTVWQFKACPVRSISPHEETLREEINKPYARDLVQKGYGYRFCIADDPPPATKAKWEAWLLDEAQKIRSDAAPPRVVTAFDLARWANQFPGVIRFFRPFLAPFRHLHRWAQEITAETEHFVPVTAWQGAMDAIRSHADLSRSCAQVVLTVQGEAGVGKTRCVYESLIEPAGHDCLVVYTSNDEEAEKLADRLANDDRFRAILVADECLLPLRVRLEHLLTPYGQRVRVIAVDNTVQEAPMGPGEIRLVRMTNAEVEAILERNNPALPRERLRAFVELSGGFVRLAIELSRQAHLIPDEGTVGPLVGFFRDHYLRARLPREEERQTVEVISLLPHVGYKGGVRPQLEALCGAVGLNPDQVVQIAGRLKQSPGFVAMGERYLYVTPRLIAQAAFQCAWARWIGADPERFFVERLPADLVDLFADQLRTCGTEGMKQVFAGFFRSWARNLMSVDLADEGRVQRLVRLAEVDPVMLLSPLRRLVESIPTQELRQLHVNSPRARRELVWMAKKFLRLPEHFADAERMLYRLAMAETEVYANNASGVWKAIFRPLLSGTPIPFAQRLGLLEERLGRAGDGELSLSLAALGEGLDTGPVMHPFGPPIVAGRIPPDDWRPGDKNEARECLTLQVELLRRLACSDRPPLREGVVGTTIDHLKPLLFKGLLADVEEIINREVVTDARLSQLLQTMDDFLAYACSSESRQAPVEIETAVRAWRQRLVPGTLHGRLISLIGRAPWLSGDSTTNGGDEIVALARELLADPGALERELPWLCSHEARDTVRLGEAMGRDDAGGARLDGIVTAAAGSSFPGLGRGYLRGLLSRDSRQADRVNALLDRLQSAHPRGVLELISGVGDVVRPVERLLATVDSGQVPVEYLRTLTYGMGPWPLTAEELGQVLNRLVTAGREGNDHASRAALVVLWLQLSPELRRKGPALPEADAERWVQDVLTTSVEVAGQDSHAWWELLPRLESAHPELAISLAVKVLSAVQPYNAQAARAYLAGVVVRDPAAVLKVLGTDWLDPNRCWRLEWLPLRELVGRLPPEKVLSWVEAHGVAAARALARHLPTPFINPSGAPEVPEVTALVLDRYGEKEEVFAAFCGGLHSGQMYEGDIAAQHEKEGDVARRFLDHPFSWVREWAQYEIDRATHQAGWWRVREEELAHP